MTPSSFSSSSSDSGPEQLLDAYLDGELPIESEQSLFNDLQASPELQGMLRETLALRRAVQRDIVLPPFGSEQRLLAAVGFSGGSAAVAIGSSAFIRHVRPVLAAVGGFMAGLALAWITGMLDSEKPIPSIAGQPAPSLHSDGPAAGVPDTVYTVRYVRATPPISEPTPEPTSEQELGSASVSEPVAILSLEPQGVSSSPLDRGAGTHIALSTLQSIDVASNGLSAAELVPVTVRLRSLATGLPSTEPVPASVRDAIMPNSAFGLLFPINQYHAVGVEMGTESFRQQFTGTLDERQVEYTQTPVLFWMGATYRWTPMRNGLLPGLVPFADATLGAAVQQGPIARASVGLQYQPVGPVQITVGLDAAALMYRHGGTWFASTKWGPTLGLGFNLGGLR